MDLYCFFLFCCFDCIIYCIIKIQTSCNFQCFRKMFCDRVNWERKNTQKQPTGRQMVIKIKTEPGKKHTKHWCKSDWNAAKAQNILGRSHITTEILWKFHTLSSSHVVLPSRDIIASLLKMTFIYFKFLIPEKYNWIGTTEWRILLYNIS